RRLARPGTLAPWPARRGAAALPRLLADRHHPARTLDARGGTTTAQTRRRSKRRLPLGRAHLALHRPDRLLRPGRGRPAAAPVSTRACKPLARRGRRRQRHPDDLQPLLDSRRRLARTTTRTRARPRLGRPLA